MLTKSKSWKKVKSINYLQKELTTIFPRGVGKTKWDNL